MSTHAREETLLQVSTENFERATDSSTRRGRIPELRINGIFFKGEYPIE